MQREKCLFIFNLPEGDLKTNLEKIQKLHYSAYQIKESNSHFQNTTLVTCLFNKSIVQDLAKNLDKKKIDDKTIHVLQYDQLNLSLKPKTDLYKFTLHTLLEWQKDTRNEQLIVCNNDSVRVFENMWNGEIVNEKCFESRKAVGSKNGLFVAVMDKDEIIVYGNVGNDLKPFQVIKMKNVFDIYFLDDDFYLFVNYREVFEYTCVVNLLTGKNIIIVKCMNEKVKMFKDKSVCYLENTKCIFKRKDTLISDKLFFDDEMKGHEKFALVTDTFMGHPLSEIDRIHEYNHFLAVLTKEKATTIYLYYKGELVKKKAYPNFVNCQFYNTEERIFVVVEKEVDERKIISVETIKPDGESTLNNIKEALTAIEVADDGFVITTENYNIMFFDKTGIYSLVKTIKKTHKCILSLNKNGKICCVYDYDKDMIEFYDRGVLINRVPHANCTSIKWSESGLYCATMSLDSKSSGLVQMFDVNGNFLWKNIFNKLTHFEWRCFYANEKCLEYVKENYDKLIGEIEEVDKDIKQTFALQAKTNIEEAYNVWKAFLMQKRSEYEQHMMNNK